MKYGYEDAYRDLHKQCSKGECYKGENNEGCAICSISYALSALSNCFSHNCNNCEYYYPEDKWCDWHDKFDTANPYINDCSHWKLRDEK